MHFLILLFRLPWIVYLVVAPLFFVGAAFTWVNGEKAEAAKAEMLRAKPPAAVAVESFNAARDANKAGEVNVIGQLDIERSMELTQTKNDRVIHRWSLIPVYPASAVDTSGNPPMVLVQDGELTDAQLMRMQTGMGKFGPILKIDGRLTTDTDAVSANEKVFAARGPDTSRAALVDPFENGRADGLKPSDDSRNIAIGLGIFGLLCVGYAFIRRAMTAGGPGGTTEGGYI